eukprot:CAMPEP_0175897998 /NCGR_PEP_ID=MMETSP0108-20121206/1020_1 /TAXON_ID=195067 ORGANISM="Goniomonas pacifica, Strain CCMP1869" /NCGR_SAMPLE_ID=MMETSP0108 /ASSEMBLY_ACC=CAM_ASM_000204 /LENGTH=358 /DNA_ID=CAMNT_0017219337 /DNA_START=93 /DNA_END=1169 /DNA_ORIENTATION=-
MACDTWPLPAPEDSPSPAPTVCTASGDGTARRWETTSAMEAAAADRSTGHSGCVLGASFSPDTPRLATVGGDGCGRMWGISDGQAIGRIEGHTGSWYAIAFSPDGGTLATACWDGQDTGGSCVKLWDGHSLECIATVDTGGAGAVGVSWNRQGNRLAGSLISGDVLVWNISRSGGAVETELWRTLKGHTNRVRSAAFDEAGQGLVSGCEDGGIKIWRLEEGEEVHDLRGHARFVRCVDWSKSNVIASASADKSVGLWNPTDGSLLRRLCGHDHIVWVCAFTPCGSRIVSASEDGLVIVWRVDGTESEQLALYPVGAGVRALAVRSTPSPSGGATDNSQDLIAAGDALGRLHLLRPLEA